MVNVILAPDYTRKNIVSVDEATARSPECPIDIIDTDIFITNAPPIPDGLYLPQLDPDWESKLEADPNAAVWTEADPDAPAKQLDETAAAKKDELNVACEAAIIAGFESSALGSPHLYQSDRDDQLNLEGMSNDGRDLPFKCRDADGVWDYRIHTAAQLKQVKQDGVDFKLSQLQQVQTKKKTVDNLMARTELPADDPDYLTADQARAEIEAIV